MDRALHNYYVKLEDIGYYMMPHMDTHMQLGWIPKHP